MAQDVAAFLAWTAEPNLESRHAAGLAVAIFLLFASILGYLRLPADLVRGEARGAA